MPNREGTPSRRKSAVSPNGSTGGAFFGDGEEGDATVNESRVSSTSFMKRMSQNLSLTLKSAMGAKPNSALPEGLNDDTVLIEGVQQKQGKLADSEFLSRYVSITKQHLAYGVGADTRAIDNVLFTDIVGVVMGLTDREETLQTPLKKEVAIDFEHWKSGDYQVEKTNAAKVTLGPCDWLVATSQNGFYDGRIYIFRADSADSKEKWAETVRRVMLEYDEVVPPVVSRLQKLRRKVRWFYVGDRCQVFVAALIMGNFTMNIFEAHFTAEPGTRIADTFEWIDLAFTIVFTMELAVNMFATLVGEFVGDAWNWFDVIVVLVSLMSLGLQNLPGADVLRLLRCFRVFRLFKRIPSLRQIIVALSASVPPMINAFALVCLVTAIYAIMSVTFFSTKSPEEFGDFFTAMFTMFQVMTGDNWSEIARDLFVLTGNGAAVGIFFVSFQLIVALVLVNVVIAVLLDEFSKAADKRQSGGDRLSSQTSRCPFERLARELSVYSDLDDLEQRIKSMFAKITQTGPALWEGTGPTGVAGPADTLLLSYPEFRAGVKGIDLVPPVLISPEDWEDAVVKGRFAVDGTIGLRGFTGLMKQSVRRYQMKTINYAMESDDDAWGKENLKAMFLGVKGMLAEDQEQSRQSSVSPAGGGASSEDYALSEVLLKRLVADMSKMHKRFDAVEKELNTIQTLKSSKPKTKLSARGKQGSKSGTPRISEESKTPADATSEEDVSLKLLPAPTKLEKRESNRAKAESKAEAKSTDSFIQGQASAQRAAAMSRSKASAPPSSRMNESTEVPASSREQQLTHRGANGTPEAARETGWNFFAQNFLPDKGAGLKSTPQKPSEQNGDPVNNLVGGFLGGFSAIGNNIPFLNGQPAPGQAGAKGNGV